jgi:hypothetical protein
MCSLESTCSQPNSSMPICMGRGCGGKEVGKGAARQQEEEGGCQSRWDYGLSGQDGLTLPRQATDPLGVAHRTPKSNSVCQV